jgi:hypothetical protein
MAGGSNGAQRAAHYDLVPIGKPFPMSALQRIVLQNSKIGLQHFFREKSS